MAWLFRHLIVVPVAFLVRYLVVAPACWLYRWVLAPLGRATVRLLHHVLVVPARFLVRYLIVVPACWTYRRILTPLFRWLVVIPATAVWQYVLWPVLCVLGVFLAACWRLAGRISRAVGRGIAFFWRGLVACPSRWLYRWVFTPVGHGLQAVFGPPLRLARETAREVRRALFSA
ncbi:hypothetical protein [Streptomyces sp. NPDC059080]|uniref:hypothetical protein n=1 Tax=Streptomyces sp. NPDC059080 TaxID=3346718 RepID=UPI00368A526F